jgi:hypothetical protein
MVGTARSSQGGIQRFSGPRNGALHPLMFTVDELPGGSISLDDLGFSAAPMTQL